MASAKPRETLIAHLIPTLRTGGAEKTLAYLAKRLHHEGIPQHVITLLPSENTDLEVDLRKSGIGIDSLRIERLVSVPAALRRLVHLLRELQPTALQTWMYHSDLAGTLSGRMAGVPHIVWNVRHAALSRKDLKTSTWLISRVCALLSGTPSAIIVGSSAARRSHENCGYSECRMVLIRNGFDTTRFRPDPVARQQVRAKWGISPDELVIGMASRYHRDKGHDTLLDALQSCSDLSRIRVVLCGRGITANNGPLFNSIEKRGLAERVCLLGVQDEMATVYNGWDIAVNSSRTEALPNAVGEAMACGVPCVATAVGDTVQLLGEAGCAVPAEDPFALAAALSRLASLGSDQRAEIGQASRAHIVRSFSQERTLRQYRDLYTQIALDF